MGNIAFNAVVLLFLGATACYRAARRDSLQVDECTEGETRETYSGPTGTVNVGVCLPQIEIFQ